ncbi:hypothetical protein Tco_1256702 [Tanacetum coccineum]
MGRILTCFSKLIFPLVLFDRILEEIRGITHNECESLTKAWLRMKEFLRFYHGHAEGIFFYKIPKYAYQLLEEKVSLKLVWAKNQKPKSVIREIVAFADEGIKDLAIDNIRDDDVTWWVDFRVTVNGCKDRCSFKTYESLNDGSILHMGNESTTLVHGRGLSEGFYDEAMLTACYLLNRVLNKINMITPYELWTKRKPNLNYLGIWGCKTVVRLHDPGLKTLGDKDPIFESQDMSTSNIHQESLADAGSETRPLMLERGSYIPWVSHFTIYLNRKRENRKWLNKEIDEGPYEFRIFTPSDIEAPRMHKEEDLRDDDLKHYEAEIEAMNLILISIPDDIYNSVDACKTAKSMWQRVERLMRGTVQNKVDRETRFNNEFDQYVAEPGEALMSVYNRFAQLMNDLERNDIIFPNVTVNTKFLNCLQPEWLKYVTQVRLAKRLTEDTYDDLFDYLHQFEKLVNASRAKKVEKSHDSLALVAHMGSSSRTIALYYVTHPSLVVDYDEDYQGYAVLNNSKDSLTSSMILFACTITQHFSNPTINYLRTSSNTRNQATVQSERVNIQSKTSGNYGRNTRRSYVQEEIIEGTAANVKCSEKGHYARNCLKPRVRDSKYFMEQMLLAKHDEAGVILTDEHTDFLFANASQMEEIEELSANIFLMATIQPMNFNFNEGPSYDSAFINEVQTPSTGYVNLLFAKDTQEQKYLKQPKIINNIIGDNQIDSNIIFDEPNGDVNSDSIEYDNNV